MEKVAFDRPMDLNAWAYALIRQMILSNELAVGEQIHIDQLTEKLGISRTPIREALLRLKQSNLVDVVPRVGYFVSGITEKEFHDVFELRGLIECYAARSAALRLTEEEIEQCADYIKCGEECIEAGKNKESNEYEILFHDFLTARLENHQISNVMDTISDIIFRERSVALGSPDNLRKSMQEHREILKAISERDPEGAYLAMKKHIDCVKERLSRMLGFS